MMNIINIIEEYLVKVVAEKKNDTDLKKVFSLPQGVMTRLVDSKIDRDYFCSFVEENYKYTLNVNELNALYDDVYIGWNRLDSYRLVIIYIESEYHIYSLPYYPDYP